MPKAPQLKDVYAFDFETTSEKNLHRDGRVRVWCWSLVNCLTRQHWLGTDLESFLVTLVRLKAKVAFAHNLRFDGSFILWHCLKNNIDFRLMIEGASKTWFKFRTFGCEFRDSFKKFPMSLQSLAFALGIGGKEESPDFDRYFPENYVPTGKEFDYCLQDSMIVAEAVSREWSSGRTRLTASSEAYAMIQQSVPNFKKLFPPLSLREDEFVRPSYAGGICYCTEKFAGEDLEDVFVYDINSSYPAQMRYQSMPTGYGFFEPPKRDQLFIVSFVSEFELRDGFIPTLLSNRLVQYASRADNFVRNSDGPTRLTLTSVDYELFHKHYDVFYEIDHEYMSYESKKDVFNEFIDEQMEIKANAPKNSHERQAAKLNMNMSYGSFGINPNAWNATPLLDEDECIVYDCDPEQRIARYCTVASFVTAYGRKQLIEAAQKNFKHFVYSDTDSIHLTRKAYGLKEHDSDLGAWKAECWEGYDSFPHAKYLRPKCYCHADENYRIFKERLADGRWNIELKCAGVPDAAKLGIGWDDFYLGFEVEGKLAQHSVPGGICLLSTKYTI